MKKRLLFPLLLLFTSCSMTQPDDPLKNSKKLIIEGHKSLYNNGAMTIPYTRLKLIPAGPSAMDIAKELIGIKAKASFQQALLDAKESVYIIPGGTQFSYDLSKKIFNNSHELAQKIRNSTRDKSLWLVQKSSDFAKEHIVGSFKRALTGAQYLYAKADSLERYLYKNGKRFVRKSNSVANKLYDGGEKLSSSISEGSEKMAHEHFLFAKEHFIQGYSLLPQKLRTKGEKIKDALSFSRITTALSDANAFRHEGSVYFGSILGETFSNYGSNISESFAKAKHALTDQIYEEGVILSTLKSMGWALKGILYDGIIAPLAKLSYATVGYATTNGIVFPIHVAVNEGIAVSQIAIELSYNTAEAAYDIVAPTAISALAGILGSTEYLGGKITAASAYTASTVASGTQRVVGHTVSAAVHTTGFLAGKSLKVIGVPIAASGIAVGEASYGVVAGTAALGTAGVVFGSGELAGLGSDAFGTVLAPVTLATGTATSVAASATVGVYQLSKAIVVPSSYALGSGTVLGYGALSHLGAHSILAVADAAYLVLSLEGPRWVIYAVSGKLKGGEKLPVGAVLDLKKMQTRGEEFRYVPVSSIQMQQIIDAAVTELPTLTSDIQKLAHTTKRLAKETKNH